jgi:hypothetical protein
VDIIGTERWLGWIAYKATPKKFFELDRSDARVIQIIERNMIITFAGGIAQRRYAPSSPWRRGMGYRRIHKTFPAALRRPRRRPFKVGLHFLAGLRLRPRTHRRLP